MDMTDMQFEDDYFDVVLDKGGLDALMEPAVGSVLGKKYLKEVKRVIKFGGKFICLTLAETHVIRLLFSEFRFGWATSIEALSQKPSEAYQTFMVAVVKEKFRYLKPVTSLLNSSALDFKAKQGHMLVAELDNENQLRSNYSSREDILYSLRDLELGAVGDLKKLHPGFRCQLILGEQGESIYTYKAVILDAQQDSDSFAYQCGVFIVPKVRAHEYLFSHKEGQWLIVESSKAARLIMVFLDARHSHASIDDIKKDLSPLVRGLAPGEDDDGTSIPFMMASDCVKERNIVQKVSSPTTGPIIVEDVIYEKVGEEAKMFRRLTFERSMGLVQSEALLTREHKNNLEEKESKQKSTSSKPKKKGGRRGTDSRKLTDGFGSNLKVDHSCLASSYHSGIISGFALIASMVESAVSSQNQVRAIIIGLGAGLLPMFLRVCLPFLDVEVVELDDLILDVARQYFAFTEDDRLKVHVCDGIKFIQEANVEGASGVTNKNEKDDSDTHSKTYNGSVHPLVNANRSTGIKILIIDADSSDLSSGLACPPADFVEESFLLCVKEFISESGLFVINLVSRSLAVREMVVSRMKKVFCHLFSLELEGDVNEVLFACNMEVCSVPDQLPGALAQLQGLMKVPLPEEQIDIQNMKCLK